MFDRDYFDKYRGKGWIEKLGFRSKKPHLCAFWKRILRRFVSNQEIILEVGTGLGEFYWSMKKVFNIVGCDISYHATKEVVLKGNAYILIADAHTLPFKKSIFRTVISFDVVEHLSNPEIFFSEARRVLIDDGILIFSTPNPNSFGAKIKRERNRVNLHDDVRLYQWHGMRDETHINIRSMDKWRNTLKANGFTIIKDGSDALWDIPYFKSIPYNIQKVFFISIYWFFSFIFGLFPWKYGENYICIAKKWINIKQ